MHHPVRADLGHQLHYRIDASVCSRATAWAAFISPLKQKPSHHFPYTDKNITKLRFCFSTDIKSQLSLKHHSLNSKHSPPPVGPWKTTGKSFFTCRRDGERSWVVVLFLVSHLKEKTELPMWKEIERKKYFTYPMQSQVGLIGGKAAWSQELFNSREKTQQNGYIKDLIYLFLF